MEVVICIGSSCHLRGSRDVIQIFEKLIARNNLQNEVELRGSFCMGECQNGVCVSIDGKKHKVTPMEAEAVFQKEILEVLQK